MKKDWKNEMLMQAILYRLVEKNETIPAILEGTNYEFMDDVLERMLTQELIEIKKSSDSFGITKKGDELRKKAKALCAELLHFEIFAYVNLSIELDEDISEDGILVLDDVYDPRFMEPQSEEEADELGTEDLRITLLDYLANHFQLSIQPEKIVFLQMLNDGVYDEGDIWFDLKLGRPFSDIEEVISNSYSWRYLAEDEKDATLTLESIFAAGMVELLKRKGQECPNCGIPLATFALSKDSEGEILTKCPNPDCATPVTIEEETLEVIYDPFDLDKSASRLQIFV